MILASIWKRDLTYVPFLFYYTLAMIIKRQKPREGSAFATYAHQRRPRSVSRYVFLAYKVLCYIFWLAVIFSGILGLSLLV